MTYKDFKKITLKFSFWYNSASASHKEIYDRAYYDGYDSCSGKSYDLAKLSDKELIVYAHGYVAGNDDAYYEE